MDWTKEIKAEVIKKYQDANPTVDNSNEIVKEIADGIEGCTVNGLRLILAKAVDDEGNKVYISKNDSASGTNGDKPKTKRVDKAASIKALTKLIKDADITVDDDILGRMTGKMAVYITGVFKELSA